MRGCVLAAALCLCAQGFDAARAQAGPDTVKPDVREPDVRKPDVRKPDVRKSDAAESDLVKPDVATLLFEQSMWREVPVGSVLRYGFARRMGRKAPGVSFDDDMVVKLDAGLDADSRTPEVRMFSGPHARAAGPFFSSNVNPVLLLVMEQNVQELGRLTGIDPSQLRNAIRKAWRDDVRIVDAPVSVAGRQVPGTRITVTPFGGDPARDRMKGFDRLTYAVEISDKVPGRIARIDIRTPAGGPRMFSETLRYMGNGRW